MCLELPKNQASVRKKTPAQQGRLACRTGGFGWLGVTLGCLGLRPRGSFGRKKFLYSATLTGPHWSNLQPLPATRAQYYKRLAPEVGNCLPEVSGALVVSSRAVSRGDIPRSIRGHNLIAFFE